MAFFKVLMLHATITVLTPVIRFDRVRRWLKKRRSTTTRPQSMSATDMAALVVRSSHWIPGTSCLTEALCCHHLLRDHGVDAALVIGLERQEKGDLQAHAWVEVAGHVILGDNGRLDAYTPLKNRKRR